MQPEELRDYIHNIDGELEVIRRFDAGSTFRIRLPISDAA